MRQKLLKIELTKIRNNAEKQLGPDKAAIFDAHLLVLDDPELIQPIEDKIANEKQVLLKHYMKSLRNLLQSLNQWIMNT